jgi:predicted nucleic acid-binding protein
MKIYLDVCCYSRPFDDLVIDRIRIEAEAVSIILERCEKGIYELISSEIVSYEISQILNRDKQDAVTRLSKTAKKIIRVNNQIRKRAQEFESQKIKPYDALHLASADKAMVNIFLTTDDRIINKRDKLKINFRILNPTSFIYEELFNG